MDGYSLLKFVSFQLSITTPSDVHTYTIKCITNSLGSPTSESCSTLTCCVSEFFKLQLIASFSQTYGLAFLSRESFPVERVVLAAFEDLEGSSQLRFSS